MAMLGILVGRIYVGKQGVLTLFMSVFISREKQNWSSENLKILQGNRKILRDANLRFFGDNDDIPDFRVTNALFKQYLLELSLIVWWNKIVLNVA